MYILHNNLLCKNIITITFYLKNVKYVENEGFSYSKLACFITVMATKAAFF